MNMREDYQKKLKEAGRTGNMVLRQAVEEILEAWSGNPEELAAMADFCREQAYKDCGQEDRGPEEIWLFLDDQVCGFAQQHLDTEGWHRFLKVKSENIPVRYP